MMNRPPRYTGPIFAIGVAAVLVFAVAYWAGWRW